MKILTALLNNEISLLKKQKQLLIMSLAASIIYPIIPIWSKFSLLPTTIRYSDSTISIMVIGFLVFGILLLSTLVISQLIVFGIKDNMNEFLLSQNINKNALILSKSIITILFAVLLSLVSIIEYKFFICTNATFLDLLKIEFTIIIEAFISALISILMSCFVTSLQHILMSCTFVSLIVVGALLFITNPISLPFWIFFVVSIMTILILFFINYVILNKKESLMKFEKI